MKITPVYGGYFSKSQKNGATDKQRGPLSYSPTFSVTEHIQMLFSFRAMLTSSLCSGLSFCMLAPAPALADSTDLMSRSTLTGDWGGERQKLVDKINQIGGVLFTVE